MKTYVIYSNNYPIYGMLTSSNLSSAAWGFSKDNIFRMNNFEMGMLFIDNFNLDRFKLAYDLQHSIKYKATDIPWISNIPHLVRDSNGNVIS